MFDIFSLIWTIPGVIGLLTYKRRLSRSQTPVDGWVYLLTVIPFGAPHYFIFEGIEFGLRYFEQLGYALSENPVIYEPDALIHLVSLIFSIPIAIYMGNIFSKLKENYFPRTGDPFHSCCYLWEKKPVFITLRNNKVYLALLLDYTRDLSFEPTIRVLPLYSGYRDQYGHVYWTFKYPDNESNQKINQVEPGLIITQKEIVTFSLWDYSHKYKKAEPIEELELTNSQ